jgi:hypothetical protein
MAYDGWMSPPARTILLGVGWALVVVALATAIVGVKTGTPVLSLVGALTGLSAWTVSGLMPEPLPAPRKSVRRRLDSIQRLSGHRLPD